MSFTHKKLPIGVDNFRELTSKESNYLFVDKTLLIKEFLDTGTKVSLIIRPRRWGKTLNMSMIQHFFSPIVNEKKTLGMFDDLKIAQENNGGYLKYQGKNPVIFISFKDVKQNTFDDFLEKTRGLIQNICNQYPELIDSNYLSESDQDVLKQLYNKTATPISMSESLQTLSVLLHKHFKEKVIILIDEYDTPLNATYNKPDFNKIVDFFKSLFGTALKGNDALEKGMMTGILRLSKNKMLSDINNLKLYSLTNNQYSQHFGFSENEVHTLFEESRVKTDMQEVARWYNGYCSGTLEKIYNPWSILNCIDEHGTLKPYWIQTGDPDILKSVFLNANIHTKEKLNALLLGESIEAVIDEYCSFDQVKENPEALWSLLWALGYLKIIESPEFFTARNTYVLQIPNYEVACCYMSIFQAFMETLPHPDQYDSFLKSLTAGRIDQFILELNSYLLNVASTFDFTTESNYHTFLLGLTASLWKTHEIHSNKEIGLGRPDMLIIPRNKQNSLGIILEFKKEAPGKNPDEYEKIAWLGLKQINTQKYDATLQTTTNVQEILKVCLVFYGKQCICQWTVEKTHNL